MRDARVIMVLLFAAALVAQAPDLILVNGKIVTLDSKQPEAQALAAREGKIIATGSTVEIRKMAGPSTKTIDLKGALAVPGLIEGHGHFTGVGHMRMQVNLRDARSWDEIVSKIADAVKKARP